MGEKQLSKNNDLLLSHLLQYRVERNSRSTILDEILGILSGDQWLRGLIHTTNNAIDLGDYEQRAQVVQNNVVALINVCIQIRASRQQAYGDHYTNVEADN